jgi:hypothetical protein
MGVSGHRRSIPRLDETRYQSCGVMPSGGSYSTRVKAAYNARPTWSREPNALRPHSHSAWQVGQAWIAPAGGADRRSAKNAAAPMRQSRQAHRWAWPLHSPGGGLQVTDKEWLDAVNALDRVLGPALGARTGSAAR